MSAVRTLDVALGARSYPIWIGAGLLADSARWRAPIRGRHVLVVTNTTVAALYLQRVLAGLAGLQHAHLVLPDGEAHKTLDASGQIFAALAALGASRDATILALGGGVIGDLAGFAAACWMRGIDFIQMPTTLLAMVDSSVGGKTGVNLPQGKNLVGAFHQPRAVVADTGTLATLPVREYRAGLAEVVKYGAINDAAFFAWLEVHADALVARDEAALAAAIQASCRAKSAIVARDEHERGERALLNFGHTFAHAYEALADYDGSLLHGEAVAVGMVKAMALSVRLGHCAPAELERLRSHLGGLGLPTRVAEVSNRDFPVDDLLAAMGRDKKVEAARIRFVLARRIGEAFTSADVPPETVRTVLTEDV